jgi:ATP synthase F1 complex assembly factor 2
VGIQETQAPWQTTNKPQKETVSSGISAGVDGTQSASGVSRHLETDRDSLQYALTPRRPGTISINNKNTSSSSWYTVTLDGRPLRTPLGQTLAVPSKLLASALATEWNAVTTTLNPTQMPLMTLTCTTLDQLSNPTVTSKAQEDCLRFFHTDTICYYADPLQDRVLYRRQEEHWKPIHEFVAKTFQTAPPATVQGAQEAMLTARNKLPHSTELTQQCRQFVHSLDAWHLQGLYALCSETKSLLLSLAILLDHYQEKQSLQEAVEAARVEEEFQISCWGMVEGGHDYDRLNCAVQIQSAVFLTDCLTVDCLKEE